MSESRPSENGTGCNGRFQRRRRTGPHADRPVWLLREKQGFKGSLKVGIRFVDVG
jgi:hypothetical protein